MSHPLDLPRRPKAVIFDMDGLLVDTVPLYTTAMIEAGHDVGATDLAASGDGRRRRVRR